MKISKKTIDAILKPEKDTFHWDEDLTGFGIKATPTGKKVFVLQTRLNGRARRFTIGTFGQPWAPDAARAEAKKLLGQVAEGMDPQHARSERKLDTTVAQLALLYWKTVEGHKKPTTIANEKGLEERHIRPLLGKWLLACSRATRGHSLRS